MWNHACGWDLVVCCAVAWFFLGTAKRALNGPVASSGLADVTLAPFGLAEKASGRTLIPTSSTTVMASATFTAIPTSPKTGATCLMKLLGLHAAPEEWCFYTEVEPCPHRHYPLTARMMKDGYVPGDVAALVPVISKLKKGLPINIVEFGGSFTAGHDCVDGRYEDKECAWPARTQRWLQKAFPGSEVNWWHLSRRATTSAGFLTGLGPLLKSLPGPPDIVVLDTLINDLGECRPGAEMPNNLQMSTRQAQVGAYERLIQLLREKLPGVHIISLLDAVPEALPKEARGIHKDVDQHYQLPIIDYAEMVVRYNKAGNKTPGAPDWLWPQTGSSAVAKGAEWPHFQPTYRSLTQRTMSMMVIHPPWTVHEKISQAVAYSVIAMLEEACGLPGSPSAYWPRESLSPQRVLEQFATCASPSSFYSAHATFAHATDSLSPRVVKGDWKLFEDRAGKPGWISSEAGATLQFPLRVNVHGVARAHILTISWLSSYKGICDATAVLFPMKQPERRSKAVKLQGLRKEKVSQTTSSFFVIGGTRYAHWDALPLFNVPLGHEQYVLEVRMPQEVPSGAKFKIVEVTSC